MSDFTIVRPTQDDRDGLIAMQAQSWIDAYPNDDYGISLEYIEDYVQGFSTPAGQAKRLGYIRESYENDDYYLRIAKDKAGKVVGFVDARRGQPPELNGLYIDKSAYGSGLAMDLAEPALQWLDKKRDIKLTVLAYNERAQRFYRKLGFVDVPNSEKFHKNTPLKVIDMIREGDER